MIKTEKLSKYALTGFTALIILVFGLFFGVGYDNPVGDYNEPQLTEVLIFLMYGMIAVTTILAAWSVIKSILENMGYKGENLSGVPGTAVSVTSLAIMVVSLVVGFCTGINETDFTAADGTVTSATMVQITDMFIWSIYILLGATTICVLVSMSGVLKK